MYNISNKTEEACEGSVKKNGNLPKLVLTYKKNNNIEGAKIFNKEDIKNNNPTKMRINLNSFLKFKSLKYENLDPIILPNEIEQIGGTKNK